MTKRKTDDLILPDDAAKAALQEIADQITELCNEVSVTRALRRLATDEGKTSLFPDGDEVGSAIDRAVQKALNVFEDVLEVVDLYTSHGASLPAGERAHFLREILYSKKDFKSDFGVEFDATPEEDRVTAHVGWCDDLIDATLALTLAETLHPGETTQDEAKREELWARFKAGEDINMPAEMTAELFGFYYAFGTVDYLFNAEHYEAIATPVPARPPETPAAAPIAVEQKRLH